MNTAPDFGRKFACGVQNRYGAAHQGLLMSC